MEIPEITRRRRRNFECYWNICKSPPSPFHVFWKQCGQGILTRSRITTGRLYLPQVWAEEQPLDGFAGSVEVHDKYLHLFSKVAKQGGISPIIHIFWSKRLQNKLFLLLGGVVFLMEQLHWCTRRFLTKFFRVVILFSSLVAWSLDNLADHCWRLSVDINHDIVLSTALPTYRTVTHDCHVNMLRQNAIIPLTIRSSKPNEGWSDNPSHAPQHSTYYKTKFKIVCFRAFWNN